MGKIIEGKFNVLQKNPMTEKAISKYLIRNWSKIFGLHTNLLQSEYRLPQAETTKKGGRSIDLIAESKDHRIIYLIELKNKSVFWLDAVKILAYKALFIRGLYESIWINSDGNNYIPVIMIPKPDEGEELIVKDVLSMLGIKYIFMDINEETKDIDIVDWSF